MKTVYVTATRDRDGDTFFEASVCASNEELATFAAYDRADAIAQALAQYPDAILENAK